MPVHYFHCTDGTSFVADEIGSRVVRDDELFLAAMRRAELVMRDLPFHDWSGWFVCVYDDLRQMVDVIDFPTFRPLSLMDGEMAAAASGMPGLIRAALHEGRPAAKPRS